MANVQLNWQQRAARWLRQEQRGKKVIIAAVVAVALGVLTVLLWPTIQRTLGVSTDGLSRFGAAAIVALIFFVIGLCVYFVAGKTLWELLELLIVPLALAGIGFWFTAHQDAHQQQIEEQRTQDAVLQAYLDQMSALILQRNLLKSEEDDPVYTLAQARTSTAIIALDAEHNRSVTRFLTDSGLSGSRGSFSLLRSIDLRKADLSGAYLSSADLDDATLTRADLSGAFLVSADLNSAYLPEAAMRRA
jgi:hypothetical protein